MPSAVIVLLLLGTAVLARVASDWNADPDRPALAESQATPAVIAYLDRIEAVCRAETRRLEAAGKDTIHNLAVTRAVATSRIASLPTPPAARDIRRRLLAERRRMDDTVFRAYSLMDWSDRPIAAYNEGGAPMIAERARQMHDTFCEFGIDCYGGGGPEIPAG